MKKYIIGILVMLILAIGGYFIYNNFIKESEYSVSFNKFTKKDKEMLEQYGRTEQLFKEGKDVTLFLKGNEEKRKNIINEIKQNKHVKEVYEMDKIEGDKLL